MRAMVCTRHCKIRWLGGGHSCCYYLLAFCFTIILSCTKGAASLPNVGKWLRGGGDLPLSRERLLGSSGSRHLLQASATTSGTVPLVIAEGGAQYLYPEMTMRAYEAAMESGADFVTCMIAITKDGKAFCHPDLELTESTDIKSHPDFITREFKFNQRLGVYSFNFTLEEIKKLKVRQTKPDGRLKAFDHAFPVATPEELIDAINARAAQHPLAKRVGLALEISNATGQMETLELQPTPVTYAIKLLKSKGWTFPSSPAMVIAKMLPQLKAFGIEGVLVQRLLRFLPTGMGKTQIGLDLSGNVSEILTATAKDASGVLLHIGSALTDSSTTFWGQSIPTVAWTNSTVLGAKKLNLTVFIWGFVEDNWSSAGKYFNTFLSDQLGMYRSLFYGQMGPLVNGVATDWPATAATTAVCYQKPVQPLEANDRPLVISSGGSVGLLPAHTNLSYLQAIKEGADYIDCILQVSKDGVLFCLESMQLSKYTDVDDNVVLGNRRKSHKLSPTDDGTPDWWSFDLNWAEIQTLKVVPKTKNNKAIEDSKRLNAFFGTLPPLSFDDFISIARNQSRTIGIYIKIDNPTFTSGLGRVKPDFPVDQIEILMANLRRRGYLSATNTYDAAVNPPLLISSYDSCGLARMNSISAGTLNLIQRTDKADPCEVLTKDTRNQTSWWTSIPGLQYIKTYAGAISPGKKTILKINNGSTDTPYDGVIPVDGVYPVVGDAQSQGLKVYARAFGNDVALGDGEKAYDFLSDPTLELQYYFDQLKVTALESQFVATAVRFLQSSCRPHAGLAPTEPRFNITTVRPGALAKEIFDVQPEPAGKRKKVKIEIIIGVSIAAFVLAVALTALLFFLYWRRKAMLADKEFRDDLGSLANLPMMKVFTQGDLVAATNNFSESSRLGKGGFGTVYKAFLPDGTIVAVKKLHYEVKQATESVRSDVSIKQLMNEVEIIGTVHNRNVVPLQGVCMDKELLLVYDYMPNGSLQEAIFDPEYPIKLDWKQWYNIALGTAKGLAYLHEECEHKIIHRDIKPANILLDNSLNARVADFGLARNVQVDETHVTTKVMGSIGYMAPDYATTGQLTERSDTYSFGMLLLTIITGRRPILPEGGDSEETVTLEWVRRKAQEGPAELLTVINPKLNGMYDPDEAIRWLYTALLCAQNDPASRPSMGDVVQMLSGNRPVPEICVMPAAVVFPDYQRSYHSQENSAKYSHNSPASESTQDFQNSGIYDIHHLDNSIIREGR